MASELRKSLTLVSVVFIDTLAIPELDGRFLHNHYSDPGSNCGRLLGSTPATNGIRYFPVGSRLRKSLPSVEGVLCITGDILHHGRLLHNRWTDFDSVCERFLGLTPAFQGYMVHLCHIKTQEVAVFCGKDLYSSPGDILLDGRLLHNHGTDFDALCVRLLVLTPAFQRYKVRLCRI